MSTVLVTGANGFVGAHLVHELVNNGIHVISIGGKQGVEHATNTVQYSNLDLLSRTDVERINLRNVDSIIHLAGLASVGPSFDDPMAYILTNIGIEANLFELAMRQDVRPRFLIISSGALYDPKASLPLTESSAVIPSSPYAVSKLGQEQMAQYYSLRGFECIIARPFNHIGPGQNLGFIVPDLTKQAIEFKKGVVDRVLVGNLDAKRDYTDVRDIARAYRLLVEKGVPGEIYNVCSGMPRSGHDILAAITGAIGVKPTVIQDPEKMRPSDTPEIYGDHSKLTRDTKWEPQISLETTIHEAVADWSLRLQN